MSIAAVLFAAVVLVPLVLLVIDLVGRPLAGSDGRAGAPPAQLVRPCTGRFCRVPCSTPDT